MNNLDALTKKLETAQEFTTQVEKYLDENFLVEGKTLRQWRAHFFIKIPDDINLGTLVDLAAQIWTKYQEAAYYRDKQHTQLAIMEQTKLDKYNEAYRDARRENEREHGKPLAAESCKVEATLAVKDLENAIRNQKVVKDFWAKSCETLTEMRKLLEIIGRALGADAYINKEFVVKNGS